MPDKEEDYKFKAHEVSGLSHKNPSYEPTEEGYLGVDPIYQNAAVKTDEPIGEVTDEELFFNTPDEGPDDPEKDARLGIVRDDKKTDKDEGKAKSAAKPASRETLSAPPPVSK